MKTRIPATYAIILLCALIMAARPVLATPTVGADGAVDGNIKWEEGKASVWYIELQRYGLTLIQDGIAREHDADIRKGILVLDWGFSHQAPDGSFAGSSDLYHSTSLFVEAAAQATLLLKNYHPASYSMDTAFYVRKVRAFSSQLAAAGSWLLLPSVTAAGQVFDAPYTHRQFLLAAAFQEIARLTYDNNMARTANRYVMAGLILQIIRGSIPIAYPNGIVNVSLAGVNPELGGYDVSYQATGIRFAAIYSLNCAPDKRVVAMMARGLDWERSRIDVQGNIDSTGSTRVGIETNRDGTLKQVNTGEVADAFRFVYQLTGQEVYRVYSRRVEKRGYPISSATVSSTGAIDTNANFDAGTAAVCSIDKQVLGADYIAAGVDREDTTLIDTGLKILDWGFARQAADGSFPSTISPFYTVAQFLEAASRATLQLQNYHPVTDNATNPYANTVAAYKARIRAAAQWLMRRDVATAGQKSMAPFTHRYYVLAAALGEAGVLCGDTDMQNAAAWYANTGLSRQQTDGVNPEGGAPSVNYQAKGLQYAGFYLPYVNDPVLRSQIITMLDKGLIWESQYIDSNGVVNTANPSRSIGPAFVMGYQFTNRPIYKVIAVRMNAL